MVFTVSGDVVDAVVVELPLGTPLSYLVYGPGGGMRQRRRPELVVSGVSNRPLTRAELDTPLSYEALAAIGSGLGSGGFIVYDDSTCAVEVAAALSGFLSVTDANRCGLGAGQRALASGIFGQFAEDVVACLMEPVQVIVGCWRPHPSITTPRSSASHRLRRIAALAGLRAGAPNASEVCI
jgi:hypothetical protein